MTPGDHAREAVILARTQLAAALAEGDWQLVRRAMITLGGNPAAERAYAVPAGSKLVADGTAWLLPAGASPADIHQVPPTCPAPGQEGASSGSEAPATHTGPDPVVEALCASLRARSAVGLAKYGTTLAREDLTTQDWLRHLAEELQDAALYATRLMIEKEGWR